MEGTKWEGQRLIVVRAGRVEGWVDGADLVLNLSADYHDEINTEHDMKWFTQ